MKIKRLCNRLASSTCSDRSRRRASRRLALEPLEQRCLLAAGFDLTLIDKSSADEPQRPLLLEDGTVAYLKDVGEFEPSLSVFAGDGGPPTEITPSDFDDGFTGGIFDANNAGQVIAQGHAIRFSLPFVLSAALPNVWAPDGSGILRSFVPDNMLPTAAGSVSGVTSETSDPVEVQLSVSDEFGIDLSTIGAGDLLVTGPSSLTVRLAQIEPTEDGMGATITYDLAPPGGTWTAAHNGTYDVLLRANQIADNALPVIELAAGELPGNAVPEQLIGTVIVDISSSLGSNTAAVSAEAETGTHAPLPTSASEAPGLATDSPQLIPFRGTEGVYSHVKINDSGNVAFNATVLGTTEQLLVAWDGQGFHSTDGSSLFTQQMTNSGRILALDLSENIPQRNAGIRLYDADLSNFVPIADSQFFDSVSFVSTISADERVIIFGGDLNDTGAAALETIAGRAYFAAIDNGSSWSLHRMAGGYTDAVLDAGETWKDVNCDGEIQPKEISGGILFGFPFNSFSLPSRAGVTSLDNEGNFTLLVSGGIHGDLPLEVLEAGLLLQDFHFDATTGTVTSRPPRIAVSHDDTFPGVANPGGVDISGTRNPLNDAGQILFTVNDGSFDDPFEDHTTAIFRADPVTTPDDGVKEDDDDKDGKGEGDNCGGGLDFGDAPTAAQSGFANSYPTKLADDGARHTVGDLFLGQFVDAEPDGQPDALAGQDATGGDDNSETADEDGVIQIATVIAPSNLSEVSASFLVVASQDGLLDAWVDFNADGDWTDDDEQIATSRPVVKGDNVLRFDVPPSAVAGATFSRFRISTAGGLSTMGAAADGEVEDHRIQIVSGGGSSDVTVNHPATSIFITEQSGVVEVVNGDGTRFFNAPLDGFGTLNVNANAQDNDIRFVFLDQIPNLVVDGGLGSDSLSSFLSTLDLTKRGIELRSIEALQMTALQSQSVMIDVAAVASMTADDQPLVVRGGAGDRLIFADADDWAIGDSSVVDGMFTLTIKHRASGKTVHAQLGSPWQNPVKPSDVNATGDVTAGDALVIINELGRRAFSNPTTQELSDAAGVDSFPGIFYDQNSDGRATALDALRVINRLAQLSNNSDSVAQGEGPLAIPASPQTMVDPTASEMEDAEEEAPELAGATSKLRATRWQARSAAEFRNNRVDQSADEDHGWAKRVDQLLADELRLSGLI